MDGDKIEKVFRDFFSITDRGLTKIEKYQFTLFKAGAKSQQAEIERLKAEIKALWCCGNCRNFIDNQPGLFHDSTYCEECTRNTSDQYQSLIDNWKPKENN